MKSETIAAISSGMMDSGIGIVRISGEDAFQIADKIFVSEKNTSVKDFKSHTVHYGKICDEGQTIDEVLLVVMRAPHTYTKEDVIEIDCHGGMYVTQRVLETVLKYGARPAEPGEFTKRAFLNGRIDLSQAESVMDLIHSKNEFSRVNSVSQLRGSLKREIIKIRESLLHEIAFIESALDDPEHYDVTGYGSTLKEIVATEKNTIDELLKSADDGILLKEGIQTVIIGKPNAGKSSLMNALLGKDRAIVTEIAGTTRDVLEEQVRLGDITLNIIDTAGIHDTDDIVEKIGVEKSKETLERADLILFVVDSSIPLDSDDKKIISMIHDHKYLIIYNKTDLDSQVDLSFFDQKEYIIPISAKNGTGIDLLEKKIKEIFFHGEIHANDEIAITNIRHKYALKEASDSLFMVMQSINQGMPEDFYTIDLMNAYTSLGHIIGASVEDDVVNEIFKKFCMGK